MEPRPWSEAGATEIEKALLRAGRADGPSKGADLRLLAGLQASLQASPPATAKPLTVTRWVKVGLVAVIAGGAAVVTHQLSRSHGLAPATNLVVPDAVAPVAAGRVPDDVMVPAKTGEPTPPARDASPLVAANAQGRSSRLAKPSREASAKPPGGGEPSLGDETRALDHAREALEAHRPSQALRLLDEYRHTFPQGRLRPEATVLRLAALLAAGRRQAADSLASQLLSDAAYESYVPRIQSLLREAKP